ESCFGLFRKGGAWHLIICCRTVVDTRATRFKQVFAIGGTFFGKTEENSLQWPWIGVKTPPYRKNLLKRPPPTVNAG
ncbi:MAG: hypothetical protein FWF44_11125, partial [Defluviitaleaceae bacterium]|nr:hypothetical protein [Defluviitaleaceae bacterium]